MVLTMLPLLFLKCPPPRPVSTSQMRTVSFKRRGRPVSLCTAHSIGLVSAGTHKHWLNWTTEFYLGGKGKWVTAQKWRERGWKKGKKEKRKKGKAWHIFKELCLLHHDHVSPHMYLHTETCGEQPGIVTKKGLWSPAVLGGNPSPVVLSMRLWAIYWALGPSSIKQLQLSKFVMEMREEFCTTVLPDT